MSEFGEAVLLASGARTTTQTLVPSGRLADLSIRGNAEVLEVFLNLTAFTTTASLTMSIEMYDGAAGAWVPVLAATALAATGTKFLRIGPYQTTAANVALSATIWPLWRVVCTHGNANSHTYSVSARVLARAS